MHASHISALALGVTSFVALGGITWAGKPDTLANLGGTTNAVFPTRPLGLVAHGAPNLHAGSSVKLVYFSDVATGEWAAEAWSLVKALDQFGTFSNLSVISIPQQQFVPATGTTPDHFITVHVPSYDYRKATYRSPYLVFVHYDDLSTKRRLPHPVYIHLPESARRLLARAYISLGEPTVQWGWQAAPPTIIGHYYREGTDNLTNSFLKDPVRGTPYSFATLHRLIQAGYSRHYSEIVFAFDAETNAITALVCKADGDRPASVCGRSVIELLMKGFR
jgi:hypothetical protein